MLTTVQGVLRLDRELGNTRRYLLDLQISYRRLCRFVLAATEHLHRRIAKMGERIRQLEDALAILQAKYSNEPHPLLRDDNLMISATTPEQEDDSPVPELSPANPPDVIEAFGTLSMHDHGVSRFFGPTGGTEVSDHVAD